MMGWHGGMMGGGGYWLGPVLMILFWLVLIVVIVFLVIKLLPGGVTPPAGPGRGATGVQESPEQMLDRMFALGELDEATYRSRRTALSEMRGQP